jgi:hypothetical protein
LHQTQHGGDGFIQRLFTAYYQIRELAARQNILKRHRPHGAVVLGEHTFPGAATFSDIALETAAQTLFIARGDEDGELENVAHVGMVERENSFNDKDGLRIDAAIQLRSGVFTEDIDGFFDRLATA